MKTLLMVTAIVAVAVLPASLVAREANEPQEANEVQIQTATLPTVAAVLDRLNTPGAREVEIRGLNLTAAQVNDAFLSTDPTKNVLVQIGKQLKPGQEVDFRTADGQRFRVQNEDGQIRVRVRDTTVQNPAALAKFLADNGVGRVEIRGVDANGNRVRFEVRDGVVKKDEVKAEKRGRGREGTSASINNENAKDRGKDLDHSIRGRDRAELERAKRDDRVDRPDRDRPERLERIQRPERVERVERVERIERVDRPERADRSGRH